MRCDTQGGAGQGDRHGLRKEAPAAQNSYIEVGRGT